MRAGAVGSRREGGRKTPEHLTAFFERRKLTPRGPVPAEFFQIYDFWCLSSVCDTRVTALRAPLPAAGPASFWLHHRPGAVLPQLCVCRPQRDTMIIRRFPGSLLGVCFPFPTRKPCRRHSTAGSEWQDGLFEAHVCQEYTQPAHEGWLYRLEYNVCMCE